MFTASTNFAGGVAPQIDLQRYDADGNPVGTPLLIMLVLQAPAFLIGPLFGPAILGVYLLHRRLAEIAPQLAVSAAGAVASAAVSSVAPRGMYVSGRSVSKAGLTATVVKDPGTGSHTFEAGAMVLSDGGVCCVDEFDKMPNEHKALLEAME